MRCAARPMLVAVSAVLLIAASPAAQKGDSAQALLRAAMDKAVVDGDLNAAIKQYQAILARFKDKPATAEAVKDVVVQPQDADNQAAFRRRAVASPWDYQPFCEGLLVCPDVSPNRSWPFRVSQAPLAPALPVPR